VRKAIKHAAEAIADADPVLGGELCAAVSTGVLCGYELGQPWRGDHP
jgi:hypothetical protein